MSALTFTVTGKASPKGSLRHVGHGRLIEQVAGSKPWRVLVAAAALDALARSDDWQPAHRGAVQVDIDLYLERPKSAPARIWPITRSSGDVDKHARNILDALVDAAVIADDSQVITLHVNKAHTENPAYTVVRVREVAA
jgi:Holliday junction resolvase RusA-like endonuclease